MRALGAALGVLMLGSLAANVGLAWWVFSGTASRAQVQLASPERVEVIRTQGGLLQVSSIRSPETFQASTDHRFLGIDLGRTVTQIRVPAVFNYHVELAPEWRVTVNGHNVLVIAPVVKPTLPVAIDTAHLEKFSSGVWSAFTGATQLDLLERSITGTLNVKAATPSYRLFQREAARQTVTEFVAKWLLTQQRFATGAKPVVHVFFADEPVDSLRRAAPIFLGDANQIPHEPHQGETR
jgi:hypothetical protein